MGRVYRTTTVLFFTLLTGILTLAHGHYQVQAVVGLALAFGFWSLLFLKIDNSAFQKLGTEGLGELQTFLLLCCIGFPFLLFLEDGLVHADQLSLTRILRYLFGSIGILTFAWATLPRWTPKLSQSKKSKFSMALYTLIVLGFITCRILVIFVSPEPKIDLFLILDRGIDLFAEGINPYTVEYRGIYPRLDHVGQVLIYPPASFLGCFLAKMTLGDLRFFHVLAEILTALGLFLLGRQSDLSRKQAALFPLIWLGFPVGAFVTEQAWTDVPMMTCLVFGLLALRSRKWIWLGLCLGLGVSIKQTFLFVPLLTFAYVLRRFGFLAAAKMTISACLLALTFFLPFAWKDPDTFVHNVFFEILNYPIRPDALTIQALLLDQFDFRFLGSWTGLVYLLALIVALWKIMCRIPHRLTLLGSLSFVYGVVFLFAKQAFCNYYHFLAFLFLLLILDQLVETRRNPSSLKANFTLNSNTLV